MVRNRFAKMPIQSYVEDKPKELPPLMIKSAGIELRPGKQDTRERKVILTTSDINEIIALRVDNQSVNSIAKKFNCSNTRINRILISNRDKIERYKNSLVIELEKQFKYDVVSKRSEIMGGISKEDIEKAPLGMKTGSMMDLTKIDALINNKSTENININLVTASKDDLLKYITAPIIKDNNIIEEETVNSNENK